VFYSAAKFLLKKSLNFLVVSDFEDGSFIFFAELLNEFHLFESRFIFNYKLTSINDYAYNDTGYEGGGNAIEYDVNGNMTSMQDKGINLIKYNYLNLPNQLQMQASFENVTINTKYSANGTKLRKENTTVTSGLNGDTTQTKTTDYLDGFQYLQRVFLSSVVLEPAIMTRRAMEPQAFSIDQPRVALPAKTPDLEFFPTAEGFYDYKKDQYIYPYKDHLGNARVSFGRNSSGNMEITDNNYYYPFGMNHLKTGNAFFGAGSYKNYKYQGQELQETGFYSFKWRNYMPDVARFFNVDPLSEKYPTWAPYVFSGNRVIDARELEGLEPYVLFKNAAANFGQQYNGKSIINKREYAALIYLVQVEGKRYFAYNKPEKGEAHGVPQGVSGKAPKGASPVAWIHAHGNDDYGSAGNYNDQNFSGEDGDKGYSRALGLDAFLVTPDGSLKYYDLSSDTERTLRTDMPSDPNNEAPRQNNIDPTLNPNPSSGDYRPKPKPFPNLEPIPVDRPKSILDGGLKSIEDRNKKEQSPLINRTKLPYHQ